MAIELPANCYKRASDLSCEGELDTQYPSYPNNVESSRRGQPQKTGYEEESVKNEYERKQKILEIGMKQNCQEFGYGGYLIKRIPYSGY